MVKIAVKDIVSVKRSYNPLSSPAASLKRLQICVRNQKFPYLLISPVREHEFLDMLKSINSAIDIQVSEKRGKWRIWDLDI
ncbi:MAG: PH domain-containing protein [Prevotellaceae bacterium]|nr:PH domain-containing protein [Prevotellaceae bacterium]